MIALAMTWLRTNPRNLVLIVALLAVCGVLLFVYLKGRADAEAKAEAAHAVAVVEAIESDAAADMKGAALAQQHAEVAASQKEELINAVAKAPDDLPDESSVRWGCELMRQQGGRPADVPACRALGL